ncbi:hypothetical protein VP01_1780g1 [Puccinia sorghi]|uniref:Uncharacterized protein n=1 Tax=Puccinia sorghi TaxID=27349 RepID=A0A0L6VER4_9BASI|nr:hypothetical protein VP01_1780g1 [Puccinia sorghi]
MSKKNLNSGVLGVSLAPRKGVPKKGIKSVEFLNLINLTSNLNCIGPLLILIFFSCLLVVTIFHYANCYRTSNLPLPCILQWNHIQSPLTLHYPMDVAFHTQFCCVITLKISLIKGTNKVHSCNIELQLQEVQHLLDHLPKDLYKNKNLKINIYQFKKAAIFVKNLDHYCVLSNMEQYLVEDVSNLDARNYIPLATRATKKLVKNRKMVYFDIWDVFMDGLKLVRLDTGWNNWGQGERGSLLRLFRSLWEKLMELWLYFTRWLVTPCVWLNLSGFVLFFLSLIEKFGCFQGSLHVRLLWRMLKVSEVDRDTSILLHFESTWHSNICQAEKNMPLTITEKPICSRPVFGEEDGSGALLSGCSGLSMILSSGSGHPWHMLPGCLSTTGHCRPLTRS